MAEKIAVIPIYSHAQLFSINNQQVTICLSPDDAGVICALRHIDEYASGGNSPSSKICPVLRRIRFHQAIGLPFNWIVTCHP